MGKKKISNSIGAEFHLTDIAETTMDDMNNERSISNSDMKDESSIDTSSEKNVSLQVKEGIRSRLRIMSAKNDVKIQGFVEKTLDEALKAIGF